MNPSNMKNNSMQYYIINTLEDDKNNRLMYSQLETLYNLGILPINNISNDYNEDQQPFVQQNSNLLFLNNSISSISSNIYINDLEKKNCSNYVHKYAENITSTIQLVKSSSTTSLYTLSSDQSILSQPSTLVYKDKSNLYTKQLAFQAWRKVVLKSKELAEEERKRYFRLKVSYYWAWKEFILYRKYIIAAYFQLNTWRLQVALKYWQGRMRRNIAIRSLLQENKRSLWYQILKNRMWKHWLIYHKVQISYSKFLKRCTVRRHQKIQRQYWIQWVVFHFGRKQRMQCLRCCYNKIVAYKKYHDELKEQMGYKINQMAYVRRRVWLRRWLFGFQKSLEVERVWFRIRYIISRRRYFKLWRGSIRYERVYHTIRRQRNMRILQMHWNAWKCCSLCIPLQISRAHIYRLGSLSVRRSYLQHYYVSWRRNATVLSRFRWFLLRKIFAHLCKVIREQKRRHVSALLIQKKQEWCLLKRYLLNKWRRRYIIGKYLNHISLILRTYAKKKHWAKLKYEWNISKLKEESLWTILHLAKVKYLRLIWRKWKLHITLLLDHQTRLLDFDKRIENRKLQSALSSLFNYVRKSQRKNNKIRALQQALRFHKKQRLFSEWKQVIGLVSERNKRMKKFQNRINFSHSYWNPLYCAWDRWSSVSQRSNKINMWILQRQFFHLQCYIYKWVIWANSSKKFHFNANQIATRMQFRILFCHFHEWTLYARNYRRFTRHKGLVVQQLATKKLKKEVLHYWRTQFLQRINIARLTCQRSKHLIVNAIQCWYVNALHNALLKRKAILFKTKFSNYPRCSIVYRVWRRWSRKALSTSNSLLLRNMTCMRILQSYWKIWSKHHLLSRVFHYWRHLATIKYSTYNKLGSRVRIFRENAKLRNVKRIINRWLLAIDDIKNCRIQNELLKRRALVSDISRQSELRKRGEMFQIKYYFTRWRSIEIQSRASIAKSYYRNRCLTKCIKFWKLEIIHAIQNRLTMGIIHSATTKLCQDKFRQVGVDMKEKTCEMSDPQVPKNYLQTFQEKQKVGRSYSVTSSIIRDIPAGRDMKSDGRERHCQVQVQDQDISVPWAKVEVRQSTAVTKCDKLAKTAIQKFHSNSQSLKSTEAASNVEQNQLPLFDYCQPTQESHASESHSDCNRNFSELHKSPIRSQKTQTTKRSCERSKVIQVNHPDTSTLKDVSKRLYPPTMRQSKPRTQRKCEQPINKMKQMAVKKSLANILGIEKRKERHCKNTPPLQLNKDIMFTEWATEEQYVQEPLSLTALFNQIMLHYSKEMRKCDTSRQISYRRSVIYRMLRDLHLLQNNFYITQVENLLNSTHFEIIEKRFQLIDIANNERAIATYLSDTLDMIIQRHPLYTRYMRKINMVNSLDYGDTKDHQSLLPTFYWLLEVHIHSNINQYSNMQVSWHRHLLPNDLAFGTSRLMLCIQKYRCMIQRLFCWTPEESSSLMLANSLRRQLSSLDRSKRGKSISHINIMKLMKEVQVFPQLFDRRQLQSIMSFSKNSVQQNTNELDYPAFVEFLLRCSHDLYWGMSEKTTYELGTEDADCEAAVKFLMLIFVMEGRGSVLTKRQDELQLVVKYMSDLDARNSYTSKISNTEQYLLHSPWMGKAKQKAQMQMLSTPSNSSVCTRDDNSIDTFGQASNSLCNTTNNGSLRQTNRYCPNYKLEGNHPIRDALDELVGSEQTDYEITENNEVFKSEVQRADCLYDKLANKGKESDMGIYELITGSSKKSIQEINEEDKVLHQTLPTDEFLLDVIDSIGDIDLVIQQYASNDNSAPQYSKQ